MEIGPLVTRAVLTVDATDSLREAATSMMERGVGSAVVLTDGKPTAIFTDREALRAIAQGKDGRRATVGEHALKRLTTVPASVDLVDAARIMREKGFRHLVVVDDADELIGVFSMRDLVVGLLEELRATVPAGSSAGEGPGS